jgi:hypothetical protein
MGLKKGLIAFFIIFISSSAHSYPYLYGNCTYKGTLPYWQIEYYTIEVPGKTCDMASESEVENLSYWKFRNKKMIDSPGLSFNWVDSSPQELGTLQRDCFGIMVSTFLYLQSPSTYTFCADADDGVVLYIDGNKYNFKSSTYGDCWRIKGEGECRTDPVSLSAGYHYVEVKYYEYTGTAKFRLGAKEGSASDCTGAYPLRWTNVIVPGVRSEYYSDAVPGGYNIYVGDEWDDTIDHNWGENAPEIDGLSPNYFSTRFATYLLIRNPDTYKFCFQYDDAIRIWFNGSKIYEDWKTGTLKEYSLPPLVMISGLHELVVEHFEAEGNATLRMGYGDYCDGITTTFEPVPEDMFAYIKFECLKPPPEEGCSVTGGWAGIPVIGVVIFIFILNKFLRPKRSFVVLQ